MSIDGKIILFLTGVFSGLLLFFLLVWPCKKNSVVELDLNKIVSIYAAVTAKSGKTTEEVNRDFKNKFQQAMQQIASKTMVISKGHVLSKHALHDYTEKFLLDMEINNANTNTQK